MENSPPALKEGGKPSLFQLQESALKLSDFLLFVCRFLRIICIYILSGVGGFLLSGIFDPTTVSVSQHMTLLDS